MIDIKTIITADSVSLGNGLSALEDFTYSVTIAADGLSVRFGSN